MKLTKFKNIFLTQSVLLLYQQIEKRDSIRQDKTFLERKKCHNPGTQSKILFFEFIMNTGII